MAYRKFYHKMSNRWHYTIRNVAGISACTQIFHTLFYNYRWAYREFIQYQHSI